MPDDVDPALPLGPPPRAWSTRAAPATTLTLAPIAARLLRVPISCNDNDGRIDVVVENIDGKPMVLHNDDSQPNPP